MKGGGESHCTPYATGKGVGKTRNGRRLMGFVCKIDLFLINSVIDAAKGCRHVICRIMRHMMKLYCGYNEKIQCSDLVLLK